MLEIEGGDVDAAMQLVRRVRVQMALSRLRAKAAERGADRLTEDDVDAEIAAARAERRGRAGAEGPARRGRMAQAAQARQPKRAPERVRWVRAPGGQ